MSWFSNLYWILEKKIFEKIKRKTKTEKKYLKANQHYSDWSSVVLVVQKDNLMHKKEFSFNKNAISNHYKKKQIINK